MSAPEELRQAAASGDRPEVERLLETYAVPLQESNRWSSALFSACNAGHTDLVRLLLLRTKPTDDLLASLAAQALVTKQERLALEIVGAGALPDEALREAAELDLGATVTELLASGRASEDGVREAVFAAAREGKREALGALLASEHAAAALAKSDDEGLGALARAVANGHDAAAALLEARGASKRGLALAAAQRGDEELLERALAAGEDVKRVTEGGLSALHFAASGGHTGLVLRLLALGADLEAETRDGRTPASVAAHEGHLDVVVALEQLGAALGRALVEAASGGRLPIVELCLAKGVPVETADEYSETALHKAAERGDVAVLRAVLGKSPKIDRGNINGWTALMRASGGGHVEAVRALIEHGAAVNHATEYGYETALSWAAKNGHLEVVDRLLRSGAAILRKGYNRPLFLAAEGGHTAVALRLCAAGAAVDEEDDGKTPLALAARGGHTTTVTALLDQGARPSARAMLAAAEAGHAAVVELLRARGAPLPEGFLAKAAEGGQAGLVKLALAARLPIEERSGHWARTPLMLAAERGARDVVELLLEAGADPNVRDSELKSCVRLAQDRGHDAVVALLVARGARAELAELGELAASGSLSELTVLLGRGAHPDVRLDLERTPLHEAAALGRLEAVRALCDAGASVDLVDADGWTALMEACDFGQLEVARALCDAKADPFVADRAGFTAFKLAERAGHAPLVALFEERELDRDWRPDLFAAARTGDVATLERMAAKGRPLDLTEHGATIVHLAAESGQLEALRFALEHGVAVDREDSQGATPLYLAAGAGHAAAVEHLRARGARYDVRDRYGEPAIVSAAARGHVDVLRQLLAAGADREATDSEGKTAFAKALEYDQTAVALLLLASGAQPGASAIQEALDKDVALVKALLARGGKLPAGESRARALAMELWQSGEPAELDHPDQALVEAVESDEPAVVRSLLERGTDPNARDAYGRTALLLAKKRGDKTIEKLLRKHGGRPLGMLCAAAGEGTALTPKTLKAALADGDTLDATDGEGNTALHLYAQAGDAKSSKALIDAGAPLDARNKEGETPLLLALQKDHYNLAARLEAAGADVAAGDPAEWSTTAHYLGHGLLDRAKAAVAKGASPRWLVHAAAGSGDLVRVALAIELGGRADAVTKTGWTAARSAASSGKREVLDEVVRLGSPNAFALHGAVSSGNAELVRYVLDGAPDVNAKDGWARTALHEAMFCGVEIATLLLDAGADPNVPDDDGSTAIFYAVSQENAELLRLLVSRGAQVSHENARGQTVSDLARFCNSEVKNALGIAEPKGRWGSSDD